MDNIFGKFDPRTWFSKSKEEKQLPMTTGNNTGKVTPGRESEEPMNAFPNEKYTPIDPDFAIEWLNILENLSVYNQDVGYAVDNIVQLSNTNWDIQFADDVPEKVRKEVSAIIVDNQDKWYNFSGGMHSFRSDVLSMAAINGAISVEIVPNKKLDNISLVRVPPKYIRFVYNKQTEKYEPFQVIKNAANNTRGMLGMKKLNTVKYKYIAWRRLTEGPYPTPPFLTAIKSLEIQKNIITNLDFIIEKLGMLGFLSVTVEPPQKKPNETHTAYYNRCLSYLEKSVYPQVQKNLSNGIAIGYKGSHEFEMSANNMNVKGAEGLVKLVEQMLFAGLKQDPNMLGRNFSTTETFGKVILAKMTNQVKEYQNMLNSLMAEIYKLFITIRGYDPNIIASVTCDPAMINDKAVEANAEKTNIENVMTKRDNGIIDQQGAATELGYEEAADPDFKANNNDPTETKEKTPKGDDGTKEVQEEIKVIESALLKNVPQFVYNTNECHGVPMTLVKRSEFNDKAMNKYANDYSGKVNTAYSKFAIKAINSMVQTLKGFNQLSPIENIQEALYLSILEEWSANFIPKLPSITQNNVEKIYTYYREDKSIFPVESSFAKASLKDEFKIPEPAFGLDDFRSIDYMAESDSMYLGKFITDESTKKKVYKYLEEQYIGGDLPFGNDRDAIAEFKKDFSNIFDLESYKIRRVIDTSVNNIRNDANVRYINQAELDEYEVIEIGDNRTCDYCNHMNGMVFDVSKAVQKIDNKVNLTPEKVGTISPFVTTVKVDDFTKMSPEQLQTAGFSTPSYHASCRGRIVAKI